MKIYHLLRGAGLRIAVVVFCLLVLIGIGPRTLTPPVLKPLFGWNLLANFQVNLVRLPRELLAGGLYVTDYLRKAVSEVEDERAAVEAERRAFAEFVEAVREIDARSERSFDAPTTALVSPSSDHEQLRTIRDHYRGSVMAVPGYEQEYGETLRENMAAEFGDDLTTAVLDGNQFTPQLKGLLATQAEAAAEQRIALLEAIDDERDSLSDARRRFKDTEVELEKRSELELTREPFGTLVDAAERSQREEKRCEKLLSNRQRQIHRKNRWVRNAGEAFLQEYLYRDLDVRFPVLQEGLERVKRLREQRRVIARVVARLD